MRQILSILAIAALLIAPAPARAADHLVGQQEVASALAAAAEGRQRNLALLGRVLERPETLQAASRVGVDPDRLRGALASLSDPELRDLAARAAALDTDPVAGTLDPDIRQLLIVFLIVAIVILVLRAI